MALGELDDDPDRSAEIGGPAPILVMRTGLGEVVDVGIAATATGGRADLRAAFALDEAGEVRLGIGAGPSFLVVPDEGTRLGLELTPLLTYGAGLYEAAAAGRLRIEVVPGGVMLAAGLSVGLAVGFRPLHGLVELTAEYERWPGASGVVLTPAFGLRWRFE